MVVDIMGMDELVLQSIGKEESSGRLQSLWVEVDREVLSTEKKMSAVGEQPTVVFT